MSNREKGEAFARAVGKYLKTKGLVLEAEYPLEVGLSSTRKKSHRFDFGNDRMIIECKHYDWTKGGHNPSAKISTLNEAMTYLYSAPSSLRKMVFVSATGKKGVRNPETFAEYYIRLHGHFVPDDIEFFEFDAETFEARKINV
ncbi:hypothetical protein ACFL07_00975 [Pseudomonadota bacterium]